MKRIVCSVVVAIGLITGTALAEQPGSFTPRQTDHGAMLMPSASDTSLNSAKQDATQERNERLGVAYYHQSAQQ